jgi:hypothetical protein
MHLTHRDVTGPLGPGGQARVGLLLSDLEAVVLPAALSSGARQRWQSCIRLLL